MSCCSDETIEVSEMEYWSNGVLGYKRPGAGVLPVRTRNTQYAPRIAEHEKTQNIHRCFRGWSLWSPSFASGRVSPLIAAYFK
jgi:hypothetical protein